jgi:hypothetical protein
VTAVCEHGAECHSGVEPSAASAPEASRAWLLIEHPGPWPHEAADAALPPAMGALAGSAVEFGIRVQMIRRPGRRQVGDVRTVFLGWTAGGEPWLRRARVSASSPELAERDLKELAGADAALAAIGAYQRGALVAERYRGRAGQPREDQEAEYGRLLAGGSLPLGLDAVVGGAAGLTRRRWA